MISERLGVGGVFIAVHRDPAVGWCPQVVTYPAAVINVQLKAEQIAVALRAEFDLKD
jgi:hypothetical protein